MANAGLFVLMLLLRLPLLSGGFGSEEDAWGHVLNAFEMNEQGCYILSRLPGHPLFEALCLGLLQTFGPIPFWWNLGSALALSAAVLEFRKILLHGSIPSSWALAAGFGALPVVWISGTTAMDYAFSLWLILAGYRAWIEGRTVASGLWLGASAGFRIVNPALAVVLWGAALWQNSLPKKALLIHIGLVCGLSALWYLPALWRYGPDFFDFYRLPLPPWPKILYKAGPGVWGILGGMGVLWAMSKRFRTPFAAHHTRFIWLTAVALYAIPYLRMPEKSAFFLPLIPFFLLWLVSGFGAEPIRWLALSFGLSGLLFGVHTHEPHRGAPELQGGYQTTVSGQKVGLNPLVGPVVGEWLKRRNRQRYVETLLDTLHSETEDGILIAGWWFAEIEVRRRMAGLNAFSMQPVYYLPPHEFQSALEQRRPVRHLPEQDRINDRKYANDLCRQFSQAYP